MQAKHKKKSAGGVLIAILTAAFYAIQSQRYWYGGGLAVIAVGVFLYYDYQSDQHIDGQIDASVQLPEGIDQESFEQWAQLAAEHGPQVAKDLQEILDTYTNQDGGKEKSG